MLSSTCLSRAITLTLKPVICFAPINFISSLRLEIAYTIKQKEWTYKYISIFQTNIPIGHLSDINKTCNQNNLRTDWHAQCARQKNMHHLD